MPREHSRRTIRSEVGPICATAALSLCLTFTALSCLNPATDDQPSNRSATAPDGQVPIDQPSRPARPGPSLSPAGGSADRDGDLEGEITNEYPTESAAEPDAGVAPADAGPDAQAPVVGGP
jgi:hypothetical protein